LIRGRWQLSDEAGKHSDALAAPPFGHSLTITPDSVSGNVPTDTETLDSVLEAELSLLQFGNLQAIDEGPGHFRLDPALQIAMLFGQLLDMRRKAHTSPPSIFFNPTMRTPKYVESMIFYRMKYGICKA
jgi:hypothetical protein